jgi:glycosyltransferase involved in cell wall biosynthesis
VIEQIDNGETGLLSETVSAEALAAAMRRFLADPELRRALKRGSASAREALSMGRFLEAIMALD